MPDACASTKFLSKCLQNLSGSGVYWPVRRGAGEGNRTLVSGLGSPHSTIEPHPLPGSALTVSIEGRSRQSINDVAASRDRSWVERNVEFQYLLTVNLVPQ